MNKPFYITTPIYYPNSNLHLGHTYTTIVCDVLKKIKKNQGYDVYLITGTDEHGQKIAEAAKKAGKEPKEFVDEIVSSAKQLWKLLNIDIDYYVRSTDKDHEQHVQKIFQKLYDKGDIYKSTYKGHYCTPCEAFWTDSQLEDGKCPDCGREVDYREEESYFFRLSKYEDRLRSFYDENPDFIKPESRKNEILNSFFKEGLQDLSVSRSNFDWGVKVPFDQKHVIYVWIDALSCYLSAIGYLDDEERFNRYWPAQLHMVAKEIMRFHVIIWPALLMALDLPLPKQVFAHGWILFDNDKMSKSKGNIVYAEPIVERYGVDALKYFVLREFTFGQDGSYTNEKFLQRLNADLANDLGNLVSRSIQMVIKYKDGIVPKRNIIEDVDKSLESTVKKVFKEANEEIEKLAFSSALESIWSLIRRCNKYIDETTPWILGNEENYARLDTVLYNLIETIRIIASLISPFMEESSKKIFESLNIEKSSWQDAEKFGLYPSGNKVVRTPNLFPRLDIEKELIELKNANQTLLEKRLKEQGQSAIKTPVEKKEELNIEDFKKLEMKVATIKDVMDHPNADKLYILLLDLDGETRQVVSGIRQNYSKDDLIGKRVILLSNLKPVNIRGVESKGMILAAKDQGDLTLLTTLEEIKNGAIIS